MGNTIFGRLFGRREARVLFMGLDAAGKTTCLYRLKLGEVVTTIPTIGFNVETVTAGKLSICAWDIGGRDKIRPLFRHYYQNTQGLIYVIDSNDRERLDTAIDELQRYALDQDELYGIPLLVLANKQDLQWAMSPEQIASKLKDCVDIHLKDRAWTVYGISAVDKNADGLTEAFEWLAKAILKTEKQDIAENWIQAWYPASEANNENQKEDNLAVEKVSFLSSWVESLKKLIM